MAGTDLREVAKRVRIRARYVTKFSDDLTKSVALAIVENLVSDTPVKTGRAVTNWRTSLKKPSYPVLFAYPDKPPSVEWARDRAMEEARQVVAGYSGRKSIWITNSVSYIHDLNEGTSTQAPPGFIEMAVQRGRIAIQRAKMVLHEVVR